MARYIKIAEIIPTLQTLFFYSGGDTKHARTEFLNQLSDNQARWLLDRPWRIQKTVDESNAPRMALSVRADAISDRERDQTMASLLFNKRQ